MPDQISYTLINSSNLNKPPLRLTQAEVIIDVTGPVDPLSLQMMRDAVEDDVKTRRTAINKMIEDFVKELPKHRLNRPTVQKKLEGFNKTLMPGAIELFRVSVQKGITQFCEENKDDEDKLKEFAEAYRSGAVKWAVNTTWNVIDVGLGVTEIVGGGAAAIVTAPTGVGAAGGSALALKGVYDTYQGVSELWGKLGNWWGGASGAATALDNHLTKMKKAKQFVKADVTQAKKLLETLNEHISAVEMTVRPASAALQAMLKEVDSAQMDPSDQQKAAAAIGKLIEQIQKSAPTITKFRPMYREADKELTKLAAGALDQDSIREWVDEQYKKWGPMLDGVVSVAKLDYAGVLKSAVGWLVSQFTG